MRKKTVATTSSKRGRLAMGGAEKEGVGAEEEDTAVYTDSSVDDMDLLDDVCCVCIRTHASACILHRHCISCVDTPALMTRKCCMIYDVYIYVCV